MTTERRRYFRIDDSALIKYRVVAVQDLDTARAQITGHIQRADNLRDALDALDTRLTDLGPALRRESRAIAEAIGLLNRKLSMLAGVLTLESGVGIDRDYREHPPTTVNLSGGGLAVRALEALKPDTWLAIDLVLLPGTQVTRAMGRVIACRVRGEGFAIGIEFDALREEDRDILISLVLRKQAQLLRQERGGSEQKI